MLDAGRQEKELAIGNGNVTDDGVPYITVVIDGGWSQRSMGHRYTAKSGVACIIGAATKKLLFFGVRSKYCYVCARSGENVAKHKCFKNWEKSSPAMEADILVEGFNKSLEMHGLEYRTIIGDGDSSVHKKLQENVDYGRFIKKSECANHIVRNYRSKLYEIAKTHKQGLTKSRIVRLGKGIRAAISHVAQELTDDVEERERAGDVVDLRNIHKKYTELLRSDVRNACNHVYGNHKKCRPYFCDQSGPDRLNLLSQPLMLKLAEASQRIQDLASSLLDNETNNLAENYMSLVAKAVRGKQICYNRRGSYFTRCRAAALQFQHGRNWHPKTIRNITNKSPHITIKTHAAKSKRQKKLKKRSLLKRLDEEKTREKNIETTDVSNYGTQCQKPDMSEEDMSRRKKEVLDELQVTMEQQDEIQTRTTNQAENEEWHLLRKKRLTASNFGSVSKRKPSSGYGKLVERLVHPKPFSNNAVEWGKIKEAKAVQQYETERNVRVEKCGLFVDLENGFLGASPDGLVRTDGIIEVKCPYAARGFPPKEAPTKLKTFCSELKDSQLKLKRNHNYYHQIQGQLHITRRHYCDFIIWTPYGMEVERIEPDPVFWLKNAKKLFDFYHVHMLPEIIDSRFERSLPIREPVPVIPKLNRKRKSTAEKDESCEN